jgi:chemotaxis response regulator CheB
MRTVLCDEDAFMREVVEALVAGTGHELAGIADTTVAAVGLIEAARPDVAIVDLSMGYNTDFDMISAANGVGARVIMFSYQVDADVLDRYSPRPTFVPKPDLIALELELTRTVPTAGGPGVTDRRVRPQRVASGPAPTGVADAQAFFEAVNAAEAGDALLSIEVEAGAERIATVLRASDRLLASPAAVRVFMPGGGDAAVASLLARLAADEIVLAGTATASVVVQPDELGADAFNRLRAVPPAAVP